MHHGDGVQAVFFADPRVLTVSVHQDGATLFPGTGAIDELGSEDARGTKVNLPLPPFTGDDLWLGPSPRSSLRWSRRGRRTSSSRSSAATPTTTTLWRRCTSPPPPTAARPPSSTSSPTAPPAVAGSPPGAAATNGPRVVPRAWTIYFAEMAGVSVADDIPPAWLDEARALAGYELPLRLSEPPARPSPIEPAEIHRIVERVKTAVWPHHS